MEKYIKPSITIIMSVHNGEEYLAFAVNSILSQSFSEFEFIIIDDGSNDGTPSLLSSIKDDRITIITNRKNLGLTRSLNIGLARAQGTYIARQDADDLSHPQRLQKQVEWMELHPELGLLGTDYELIDTKGNVIELIQPPTGDKTLRNRLLEGNIFCHGSVMLRKVLVEQTGGYDERFPVTQDYDLWLRMSEICEIDNLPQTLYQLRIDPGSITRKKRATQLSYRKLALTLAELRKVPGSDFVLPENVLEVFPPEPERMIRDARWAAYLYFLADDLEAAADSLRHGYEMDAGQPQRNWQKWCINKANDVARRRNNFLAGEHFITWVYQTIKLEPGKLAYRITLGKYYFDLAFSHFQDCHNVHALALGMRAMRYDPRLLLNRGLMSILFKSIFSLIASNPK